MRLVLGWDGVMGSVRSIATALATALLAALLCGGSCRVSYCSDDGCDPCVQQCKCRKTCQAASIDFESAHRLADYRLAIVEDPDGAQVRIVSGIVGLSLAFVPGAHERTAQDHLRFARGVIEVNAALLAPRGGPWEPEPVQIFETAVVIPFRRIGAEDSLAFLFDRLGNLVEIDGILRPLASRTR